LDHSVFGRVSDFGVRASDLPVPNRSARAEPVELALFRILPVPAGREERWNVGTLEWWNDETLGRQTSSRRAAGIRPRSTHPGRFAICYSLYRKSFVLSILHNLVVAVKQNLLEISGFSTCPSTGLRPPVHAAAILTTAHNHLSADAQTAPEPENAARE
jgi:hypothetical protein